MKKMTDVSKNTSPSTPRDEGKSDETIRLSPSYLTPEKCGTRRQWEPSKDSTRFGPPLKIAVASGGTKVMIDGVRNISNESSGSTGRNIAECVIELGGHEVVFVAPKDSRFPYRQERLIQGQNDWEETEQERAFEVWKHLQQTQDQLSEFHVAEFHAYHQKIRELAADPSIDVIIMAVAGSDFGPSQISEGKISSKNGKGLPPIDTPLPKMISEIKNIRRDVFLVGFKLEKELDPAQLIEVAYNSLLKNKQDLVVANMPGKGFAVADAPTYLVTIERGVIACSRRELPDRLRMAIEARHSKQHFHTDLKTVDHLPIERGLLKSFLKQTHELSHLALFNPYKENAREEFGFVAKRVSQGTLITGRGSSKSQGEEQDLAIITNVDEQNRKLSVTSTGKKASLNGNVAHLIFENAPEINYIVHSHIELSEAVKTQGESAPGTIEDWEAVRPLVLQGERIIQQPNHGVLVLLEELSDLNGVLRNNGIYRCNPHLYDLTYARFLQSERFIETCQNVLPRTGRILDIAAGTGDVSSHLYQRGYHNLTLLDPSEGMLSVAKEKLDHLSNEHFINSRLEDFKPVQGSFDGAVMRQAINYIAPKDLTSGLTNVKNSLSAGAPFIVNSFLYDKNKTPKVKPPKKIEVDDHIVITTEGNLVEENGEHSILHHGQRSEIYGIKTPSYQVTYDYNAFYIYSEKELEKAFQDAGFQDVQTYSVGSSLYVIGRSPKKLAISLEGVPETPLEDIQMGFTPRAQTLANDIRTDKIDLRHGTYRNSDGSIFSFQSVREAKEKLQEHEPKGYGATTGHTEYHRAVQKLLFGERSEEMRGGGNIATVQAPGATGAIRFALEVLSKHLEVPAVYSSNPTWSDHLRIAESVGLRGASYPYYDYKTHSLDLSGMSSSFKQMQDNSVLIIQPSGHNPTALTPNREQWQEILPLILDKKAIILFDLPYQGLVRSVDEDAWIIRECAKHGVTFFTATSYSKNFSLYEDHLGALTIHSPNADTVERVHSRIREVIRTTIGSPAVSATPIVSEIINNDKPRLHWERELATVRREIAKRRKLLVDALKEISETDHFAHLSAQEGMFAFFGMRKEEVRRLREEESLYLVGNGSLSLGGLREEQILSVAERLVRSTLRMR